MWYFKSSKNKFVKVKKSIQFFFKKVQKKLNFFNFFKKKLFNEEIYILFIELLLKSLSIDHCGVCVVFS